MEHTLSRRLLAEFLGTAFLLMSVVGSGIMGQQLFDHAGTAVLQESARNPGLILLSNSLATGGALIALIIMFGAVSGAHFNPVVTLGTALRKQMTWTSAVVYIGVQIVGACIGVMLTHLVFGLPPVLPSTQQRPGLTLMLSEFIATFGLIGVVVACARRAPSAAPYAVAAYIMAAYWFTSSTSFANPAVTIARSLTDTFTGICYENVPGFLAAQLCAAFIATPLFAWLFGKGQQGATP